MAKPMTIYCCPCDGYTAAELVTGADVYHRRPDLKDKWFWRCPTCKSWVGCHGRNHKPLGVIATKELKKARQHIHALIDPIWKSGRMPRGEVYRNLSDAIGREYHTANLRSIEEARSVYRAAKRMIERMQESA